MVRASVVDPDPYGPVVFGPPRYDSVIIYTNLVPDLDFCFSCFVTSKSLLL
jgi:hypothetical protein